MSRAFVKETAESAPPPERMVDEGPNLVTPEGLAQIEAHIARLEASLKSEANVLLRETLARDLRYWEIRKSSAEVVHALHRWHRVIRLHRHHPAQGPHPDLPHRGRG